ncbi:hypothetical protein NL108_016637 [Boleophthalmus pectinirostris]|nr:hypothetical protein NL108_016637 [Boleophthalmus pectinirostris]
MAANIPTAVVSPLSEENPNQAPDQAPDQVQTPANLNLENLLLKTLEHLTDSELENFVFRLRSLSSSRIRRSDLVGATRPKIVEVLAPVRSFQLRQSHTGSPAPNELQRPRKQPGPDHRSPGLDQNLAGIWD